MKAGNEERPTSSRNRVSFRESLRMLAILNRGLQNQKGELKSEKGRKQHEKGGPFLQNNPSIIGIQFFF